MRLIDRLQHETLRGDADHAGLAMQGTVTPADYRRFLIRRYGVVHPIERAVATTPRLDEIIDVRRFHKHELLRRDLQWLRLTATDIDGIPQCSVPAFESPEDALGWANPIERSTLAHLGLFRHLATVIPGEVAFTSSFLTCYFGAVGEMWRAFGDALDRFGERPASRARVIAAAKAAYACIHAWHRMVPDAGPPPGPPKRHGTAS